MHIQSANILLEIGSPFRTGDRHDVLTLRENPGQSQLRSLAALLPGKLFDPLHQMEIALEILALEARGHAAKVVRSQVVELLDLPGEKATPERAVRYEADSQRAAGGQDFIFGIAAPKRVFGLKGRYRMNFDCAPQGFWPSF